MFIMYIHVFMIPVMASNFPLFITLHLHDNIVAKTISAMSPYFHSSLILRTTCIYMNTIPGINKYVYVLAILIYIYTHVYIVCHIYNFMYFIILVKLL